LTCPVLGFLPAALASSMRAIEISVGDGELKFAISLATSGNRRESQALQPL